METDVTQSALFLKLWAWADKNRKQLLYGLIALLVVGAVVAFWMVHQNETQTDASYALSKITSRNAAANAPEAAPDSLLKVVSDYPDTDAAQRAMILAAGDLYTEGKYDDAQAQFQKFIQQFNSSPFAGQAALGVASCYDALGKTNDAVSGYEAVISKYPALNVVRQARLSMARLLVGQGKYKDARTTLEELARSFQGTSTSAEAASMLEELDAKHPEIVQPKPQATPMSVDQSNLVAKIRAAMTNSGKTNINIKVP